jgi:hypothetical protein
MHWTTTMNKPGSVMNVALNKPVCVWMILPIYVLMSNCCFPIHPQVVIEATFNSLCFCFYMVPKT